MEDIQKTKDQISTDEKEIIHSVRHDFRSEISLHPFSTVLAALAIGYLFGAVSGFSLGILHFVGFH